MGVLVWIPQNTYHSSSVAPIFSDAWWWSSMVTNGSLPPNEKPQVDTTKLIAWGFSIIRKWLQRQRVLKPNQQQADSYWQHKGRQVQWTQHIYCMFAILFNGGPLLEVLKFDHFSINDDTEPEFHALVEYQSNGVTKKQWIELRYLLRVTNW